MKKYYIIWLIIILCTIWAFFIETNFLIVKSFNIKCKNLSGLKIVFISDLHLRPNQELKLSKIVQKINNQKPDIVLSSGDLVNGYSLTDEKIAQGLSKIKSNYGVYTVLGNHDCWQDEKQLVEKLQKYNINVLQNTNIFIKDKNLYIAGLEDDTMRNPSINDALKNTINPRILLVHNPDMYHLIKNEVTLVLAGHNHGGQINLPFIGPLFVPAQTGKKYVAGFYDDNYKKTIVTKGIGTSVIHARFNCIPEIVVINFN